MAQYKEIEENVIADVKQIAEKYGISMKDILKILSVNEKGKKTIFIIRYSDSELETVQKRSEEKGLSVGQYCALCFKKATMDKKLYENIDLVEVSKRQYRDEVRRNRIGISIKTAGVNPKEMIEFAESRGIETSALIRYFSLTVSL